MTEAESRARKTELQRARRAATPHYGRNRLLADEKESLRVVLAAIFTAPDGIDWVSRSACGPDTAELFFEPDCEPGERGELKADREYRESAARRLCGLCPVRAECLADGAARDWHSLRGGMSAAERVDLARTAAA